MSISGFLNRYSFRRIWSGIRSLTGHVWILLIIVFILGFAIRGGIDRKGSGYQENSEAMHDHSQDADSEQAQIWTCSMHPQIRLPRSGQCPICFMDLIPLETGDIDEGPRELKMSATAVKLAEIATTTVSRVGVKSTIRLSGKVQYDETRVGKIASWVPGRIEQLYVNFTGTTIRKGDPLVELYSPSLYVAQEELLQAIKMKQEATQNISRETAEMTFIAAKEKLRQLGITDDQLADIETTGTASHRITIFSPMTGVVTHKNALEGMYVATGTQIYTIADLRSVWIVLDAYESDVNWLKRGQLVTFSVEAVPSKTFTGKVVFIDPILNEKTRTIKVRLNVKNSSGLLKPGMFVRADVEVKTGQINKKEEMPVVVPASAVLRTGKRAVVYVKKPQSEEPIFEGREVILGGRTGDYYIVDSGLTEGEEVVTKGNFKIDSAFQIMAKPSMMNPEGGVAMTGHEHHSGAAASSPQQNKKPEKIMVSDDFRKMLDPVYASYFKAQSALSNDDFQASQTALTELGKNISNLQSTDLPVNGQLKWDNLKERINSVTKHSLHWSDINLARKAFETVSNSVFEIDKVFGHSGEATHYQIYCPMAFDNKGAIWLQTSEVVNNPYFGSTMLRCGEVQATLTAERAN